MQSSRLFPKVLLFVMLVFVVSMSASVFAQGGTESGTIDDTNWFIRYELGEIQAGQVLNVTTEVTSGDITLYLNLWPSGSDTPITFGDSLTLAIENTNFYTLDVVRNSGTTGTYNLIYFIGNVPADSGVEIDPNARPPFDIEAVLEAGCVVNSVPAELNLDSFYQKYCDLGGVPVISSAAVPDVALQHAWFQAANILSAYPAAITGMQQYDIRIGVMGKDEVTTNMPEYADLAADPNTDWDTRARGLGATIARPLVSGAEENILCYENDVYRGEDIFLHEFAHTFKEYGIQIDNPTFHATIQNTYNHAIENNLWTGTYAMSTVEEYWAEGVQTYFNANINMPANDRSTLETYDPDLFAIINGVFRGIDWMPTCGCTADVSGLTVYDDPVMNDAIASRGTGEILVIGQSTDGTWAQLVDSNWVPANSVTLNGDCENLRRN